MWSKNKPAPTRAEQEHIDRLKAMQWCACCEGFVLVPEVHEIEQGKWFVAMPLCADCHRGSFSGLGGQKRAWTVRKLTELGALSRTIRRLMTERVGA